MLAADARRCTASMAAPAIVPTGPAPRGPSIGRTDPGTDPAPTVEARSSAGLARIARSAALALLLALGALAALADARPALAEELYVVDSNCCGESFSGGVTRVNTLTGARKVVSSGGAFDNPTGVAVEADGSILVADSRCCELAQGGVVRVNPTTGAQRAVTSGGNFVSIVARDVAVEADGSILVAAGPGRDDGMGAVIRVNPATGTQMVVSRGDKLSRPSGVAVAADGSILVADRQAADGRPSIIRVHAGTGAQTVVFSDTLNNLSLLYDLAVEADGSILLAAFNKVIRVNPATGAQTVVSQGGGLSPPTGVAVGFGGSIFVSGFNSGSAVIQGGAVSGVVRVDPSTGAQTAVTQGGSFVSPSGVAVAPSRLSIRDVRIVESAANPFVSFNVTLANSDPRPVTVRYRTVSGSATSEGDPADFVAASGILTFSPGGALTQVIRVQVYDDDNAESTETFSLVLSNPTNAVIADGEGVATIFDNDTAPFPAATANLGLSISGAPASVQAGDELTYTLQVTNGGAAAALGVTLTDTLPDDAAFVSAASSAGACSQADGTVTCDLGNLAAGATATATIVVRPAAGGTLTTTASVQAAQPDTAPADNTATATTTVSPGPPPPPTTADLGLTIAAAPDPVGVGADLTYTLRVANAGPAAATAATLVDSLPVGATFVSAASAAGACAQAARTVTCDLGTVAANGTATATIVVRPTAAGPLTTTARVEADEADLATANNTATATTTVTAGGSPPPGGAGGDLSLRSVGAPTAVAANGLLTYTLTVTNAGPGVAALARAIQKLPPTVQFVAATSSTGGTCGFSPAGTNGKVLGRVLCQLGDLPVGATATATIQVRPTAAGTLATASRAKQASADPNLANNQVPVTTTVTP